MGLMEIGRVVAHVGRWIYILSLSKNFKGEMNSSGMTHVDVSTFQILAMKSDRSCLGLVCPHLATSGATSSNYINDQTDDADHFDMWLARTWASIHAGERIYVIFLS